MASICLTTGNCAGAGGGVTTAGGVPTQLAFFTGPQSIASDADLFFDPTNKRLGIGTSVPLATLDVQATSGTGPIASISGQTTATALTVDQSGSGALFTASVNGANKFTIANNGNLTAAGTLTGLPGITSSGAIQFTGLGTGTVHSDKPGLLSSSAVDLGSTDVTGILPVLNGGSPFTQANWGNFLKELPRKIFYSEEQVPQVLNLHLRMSPEVYQLRQFRGQTIMPPLSLQQVSWGRQIDKPYS